MGKCMALYEENKSMRILFIPPVCSVDHVSSILQGFWSIEHLRISPSRSKTNILPGTDKNNSIITQQSNIREIEMWA